MPSPLLWTFSAIIIIAIIELVKSAIQWNRDRKTCNICGQPNFVVRGSKLRKQYTCVNDHDKSYVTLRGLIYIIDADGK